MYGGFSGFDVGGMGAPVAAQQPRRRPGVYGGIPGDPNSYTVDENGMVGGTMIGRADGGGYGADFGAGPRAMPPQGPMAPATGGGFQGPVPGAGWGLQQPGMGFMGGGGLQAPPMGPMGPPPGMVPPGLSGRFASEIGAGNRIPPGGVQPPPGAGFGGGGLPPMDPEQMARVQEIFQRARSGDVEGARMMAQQLQQSVRAAAGGAGGPGMQGQRSMSMSMPQKSGMDLPPRPPPSDAEVAARQQQPPPSDAERAAAQQRPPMGGPPPPPPAAPPPPPRSAFDVAGEQGWERAPIEALPVRLQRRIADGRMTAAGAVNRNRLAGLGELPGQRAAAPPPKPKPKPRPGAGGQQPQPGAGATAPAGQANKPRPGTPPSTPPRPAAAELGGAPAAGSPTKRRRPATATTRASGSAGGGGPLGRAYR